MPDQSASYLGNTLFQYAANLGITAGFYGILCLLFLWSLTTFAPRSFPTAVTFAGTIVNFGVFTAHLVCQTQAFWLFVQKRIVERPDSHTLDLWLYSRWDSAAFWLGHFSLLICDAFVIWRMRTLLEKRRWSAVLPALLWLITLIFLAFEIRFVDSYDLTNSSWLSLIFSLTTNVLSTVVIGYKLWKRRSSIFEKIRTFGRRRRIFQVVLIIIESGLVNAAIQIAGPISTQPFVNINFSLAALYPVVVYLIVQYKMAMADRYGFSSDSVRSATTGLELGIELHSSWPRRPESVQTQDTLVSEVNDAK